jgi:hypothetical protein
MLFFDQIKNLLAVLRRIHLIRIIKHPLRALLQNMQILFQNLHLFRFSRSTIIKILMRLEWIDRIAEVCMFTMQLALSR